MDVEQELLELEHHGWRSLCDGTGGDFYGDLMTPDALMILAHCVAMDRAAVVESLADAPTWNEYEIVEPTVIRLNLGAAVLVYTGRASRPDAHPFTALMASHYVRADDGWRLKLYQQTPVQTTGPRTD